MFPHVGFHSQMQLPSFCTKVLGRKKREQKEWMTSGTWEKIEKRRELNQKINRCCDQQQRTDLRAQYWEVNLEVKKSARQDKKSLCTT